jgi:hypothetical protein
MIGVDLRNSSKLLKLRFIAKVLAEGNLVIGETDVGEFFVFPGQKLQPIETPVGQLVMLQTQLHQVLHLKVGRQHFHQIVRSQPRLAHRYRVNLVFKSLEKVFRVTNRLVVHN